MSFKSAFSFSNTSAVQYHIAKHQKILQIILSVSPLQIRPHIKNCVINHHKLLIYVDSAVWATQLRFFHTQIKKAINSKSRENISQIRIRLLPPTPYRQDRKAKKIIPSAENIALIHNHATTVTEGKLKNALFNLSQTLQQRSQQQE